MALSEAQFSTLARVVFEEQIGHYRSGATVQVVNHIPKTSDIPLDDKTHWLRIPNVVCVFVDMMGSTKLSAAAHEKTTAGAYQLFTGSAVRLFDALDAPYIDVRGDGVFAMFNSDQCHLALAAAITFKTFASTEFKPRIDSATGQSVGCHVGIDQKTVLVKKIGLRRMSGRTDRQNEVWAGKPVNMAAKLASMSQDAELLVSDRFFANLKDAKALRSCGCPGGAVVDLWTKVDVRERRMFDFDSAYSLKSNWCVTHGSEYFRHICLLDQNENRS
jgi:class 3 adenylate cyclase